MNVNMYLCLHTVEKSKKKIWFEFS